MSEVWVVISNDAEDRNLQTLWGVFDDLNLLKLAIEAYYEREYGYEKNEVVYSQERLIADRPTRSVGVSGHRASLSIVRMSLNQLLEF